MMIVPALGAAFCLIFIWRSLWPLTVIVLSPFVVNFAFGAAEWFRDRPQFCYMGLPRPEFFNLDSETRCYKSTRGDLIHGGEWVADEPHNAGLDLMLHIFGRARRSYQGPYPTKSEAVALTESAPGSDPKSFEEGSITANGKKINLGTNFAERLQSDLGASWTFLTADPEHDYRRVNTAVVSNECLLIRLRFEVPSNDRDTFDLGPCDGIMLIDLNTMRPFAQYVLKGDARAIPSLLPGP